jgi:hypothetical protein
MQSKVSLKDGPHSELFKGIRVIFQWENLVEILIVQNNRLILVQI